MKGSLLALTVFVAGALLGVAAGELPGLDSLSVVILYALMLQVGLSIGRSPNFGQVCRSLGPRLLLLPVATVTGTLLGAALAGWLLSRWDVMACMAVGSGMGYYSLSSVLITQLEAPTLGTRLAAELGTIALLSNIFREMMALIGAPLFRRLFGPLAPVAVSGATSADVTLPVILRVSGADMVAVAVFHGLLLDMSVPFFVSLFCAAP